MNWHYGQHGRGYYHVSRKNILDDGERVRAALQALIDAWRTGQTVQCAALLRTVAQRGYELYDDLFFGEKDQRDRDEAKRVKQWVAQKIAPLEDTITFRVPEGIHVPWGLIYDDPEIQKPDSDAVPDGFWCMKYNVGVNFIDLIANGVETAWQIDDLPVLFGAHEDIWQAARSQLRGGDRQHLEQLLDPIGQPKFSLDALADLWRACKDQQPYGLLCLLCHASVRQLCMGTDASDTINHSRFAYRFARDDLDDRPPTLVFIAGCQTAVGDLESGFLHATSGPGYSGFIGTEVKVPDLFTLGFLSEFLERFYAGGRSVGDVLHDLRREHWPLSLVFSMGCARELRLAIPEGPLPAELGRGNLCDHPISSKKP